MEDRQLPMQQVSPFHTTIVILEKVKGQYNLESVVTRFARTKSKTTSNCLRGSSFGFILGFIPEAFPRREHDHKVVEV